MGSKDGKGVDVHVYFQREVIDRARELRLNVSQLAGEAVRSAISEREGYRLFGCPACGGTEWTAFYVSECRQPVERLVVGPDGKLDADYTQPAEIIQEGETEVYRCNDCGMEVDAAALWRTVPAVSVEGKPS